jgi:hypothetical protein
MNWCESWWYYWLVHYPGFQNQNVYSAFFYNCDKDDYFKRYDLREQIILVPSSYIESKILILIHKQVNKIIFAVCIASDWSIFKSFIIIDIKSLVMNWFYMIITKRTSSLFLRRITTWQLSYLRFLRQNVLFSEVRKRRYSTGYNGKAILLTNWFEAHYLDEFSHKYSEVNINVLFFVLIGTNIHFSHLFIRNWLDGGRSKHDKI